MDVSNAFRTYRCSEGDKVILASCLLKDMTRNWWEEVGRVVGDDVVYVMSSDDFSNRF